MTWCDASIEIDTDAIAEQIAADISSETVAEYIVIDYDLLTERLVEHMSSGNVETAMKSLDYRKLVQELLRTVK